MSAPGTIARLVFGVATTTRAAPEDAPEDKLEPLAVFQGAAQVGASDVQEWHIDASAQLGLNIAAGAGAVGKARPENLH